MTKELGFVKVRCGKCGHVNLIPVIDRRIAVEDVARYEKCGKVIAIQNSHRKAVISS